MIRKNFWLITLCVFLIMASVLGLSIPLRVAIGLNAILIILDVLKDWRRIHRGRKEEN